MFNENIINRPLGVFLIIFIGICAIKYVCVAQTTNRRHTICAKVCAWMACVVSSSMGLAYYFCLFFILLHDVKITLTLKKAFEIVYTFYFCVNEYIVITVIFNVLCIWLQSTPVGSIQTGHEIVVSPNRDSHQPFHKVIISRILYFD